MARSPSVIMSAKETKAKIRDLSAQIKALDKASMKDQKELEKRERARQREINVLDRQLVKLGG